MKSSTSVTYMKQRSTSLPQAWTPVLFGVMVICFESTQLMGAGNTSRWINDLVGSTAGAHLVAELNHILRKTGHFTGYGLLGLLFAQGWLATLRSRLAITFNALRVRAAALGIGSAFLVACCDEWHQLYTPGRGASFYDVLLDTSGALALNAIYWSTVAIRRQRLLLNETRFPVRMKSSYRLMRKAALRTVAEHLSTDRRAA